MHTTLTRCGLGRGVARRSGSCGEDSLGPSICGSRTALDGWWRTWLLRLQIATCRVMPIRWAPRVGSMLPPSLLTFGTRLQALVVGQSLDRPVSKFYVTSWAAEERRAHSAVVQVAVSRELDG